MPNFDSWETELYHHGILGQKWGIRRFQNKDGSRTPEGQKRREMTDRAAAKLQKKADKAEAKRLRNPKNLTDDELKQRVARLELEKRYRELNSSKLSRTVDYVRKFNKERAENKERMSKFIASKNDKRRLSLWYKVSDKLAGSVGGAVSSTVESAIKRVGGTVVGLIPDTQSVKKGAKWVATNTPKAVKAAAQKASSAVKKGKESAGKSKNSALDKYYDRRKKKASKDNPWTW